MANKKSNRTQIKDIAAEAQELTADEAGKVVGGATAPTTTTTTTTAPTTPTTPPPSPSLVRAGYDLKQNKAV